MTARRQAAVCGGSIGGLTMALLLRDSGWDVDVFERSPVPLEGRGGGIVAHPATIRYLVERARVAPAEIAVFPRSLRYLDGAGAIAHEEPCRYGFTSYNALYLPLVERFDRGRYHLGHECVGLDQTSNRPSLVFASGGAVESDLAVFADGIHSIGRTLLEPGARPQYAGYVAWRGTVGEAHLGPGAFAALSDSITYHVLAEGHVISYPIPGPGGAAGSTGPLLNWLWYRNVPAGAALDALLTGSDGVRFATSVPPGLVSGGRVADLARAAREILPAALAEMVGGTPAPYIQAIFDIVVSRMAFGRACLIGDGAFTARPHIAAGTAKAAEDAWTLAEALEGTRDVLEAVLASWSERQVALGAQAVVRSQESGTRLQSGRWPVGEPLPYGLYFTGDSSIAG